ncbi:MAG: hypothetical protein RI897_2810 [Verrucomicrobiota bacterium]
MDGIGEVAGEGDALAVDFCPDEGAFLDGGILGDLEPIEACVCDVVLLPDDFLGPGVAGEAGHPGEGFGIESVHPVTEAVVDFGEVGVAVGVFGGESVEFGGALGDDFIAFVGGVVAADEEGEGKVTEAEEGGFVGVSGHHGCGGEAVGHAWGELPYAVASGGVTEQVDAVGVDIAGSDVGIDEFLEEGVDMGFVPEVPGIGGGAWGEVDAFGERVEFSLVLPLAVIDCGGCVTAAVHGDPEAMAIGGGIAEGFFGPAEGFILG